MSRKKIKSVLKNVTATKVVDDCVVYNNEIFDSLGVKRLSIIKNNEGLNL